MWETPVPAPSRWRTLRLGAALVVAALFPAGLAAQEQSPGDARVLLLRGDAAALSRELARAAGSPVEVRGGRGRSFTLDYVAAGPTGVVARAARDLGGRWSARLRVEAPAGPAPERAPVLPESRRLSLNLSGVSAFEAFAMVTAELRLQLETSGELATRVSLPPVVRPAEEILDELARQAGARWGLAFTLELADAVVRTRPSPEPPPGADGDLAPVRPVPRSPLPTGAPRAGLAGELPRTGSELREAVRGALGKLLRVAPDLRAAGLAELKDDLERLLAPLAALPPAERQERVRHLAPLVTGWKRLYGGLAPHVQRELAPVGEWLSRYLGAR